MYQDRFQVRFGNRSKALFKKNDLGSLQKKTTQALVQPLQLPPVSKALTKNVQGITQLD